MPDINNSESRKTEIWCVTFWAERAILEHLENLIENTGLAIALSSVFGDPSDDGTPIELQNKHLAAYVDLKQKAETLARLANNFQETKAEITHIEPENWVKKSQQQLHAVAVGRFFIYGQHDQIQRRAYHRPIRIDAGMAFGTGHHATTCGCLALLQDWDQLGGKLSKIADIGCGSGILGIGAARLGTKKIYASDIDSIAVKTAKENFRQNGLRWFGQFARGSGTKCELIRKNAPFDLVFANILSGPLIKMAPELISITRPGGALILSGFIEPQARQMIATYRLAGVKVWKKWQQEHWCAMLLIRK